MELKQKYYQIMNPALMQWKDQLVVITCKKSIFSIAILIIYHLYLKIRKMSESKESEDLYNKRKIIATTISSPIASLIAKFVTYPIDTVKTKVQADTIRLHNLS